MQQNHVADNVKRAVAKAMMEEVLQMLDSSEGKALTMEELVAQLKQFKADPPEEKPEKIISADAEGKELKNQFWVSGDVLCPNSSLLLRKPMLCDLDAFLQLQQEYSPLRALLKDETYCSKIWEDHNDDTSLMLSITRSGEYVGYCGIKDLSKKPWEIAIELLPKWTHQKIGAAAITAMLDALKARLGAAEFRVRIDPANSASQGLFEKLGAKPNGISKFMLHHEDEIRQCEETNLHLIDDRLIAVAKKFDVEPRKLLSHVLEYTLCWN